MLALELSLPLSNPVLIFSVILFIILLAGQLKVMEQMKVMDGTLDGVVHGIMITDSMVLLMIN